MDVKDSKVKVLIDKKDSKFEVEQKNVYYVQQKWASICYNRMVDALNKFKGSASILEKQSKPLVLLPGEFITPEPTDPLKTKLTLSPFIFDTILGNYSEKNNIKGIAQKKLIDQNGIIPSIKNMKSLNLEQSEAVEYSLNNRITLIQGPPGTGKSITSAYIIYYIAKKYPQEKILVCSASNTAVDNIAYITSQTGAKVLRICAISREQINTNVLHLSLHKKLWNWNGKDHERFLNDLKQKEETDDLTDIEEIWFKKKKEEVTFQIIKEADIIFTTCMGANDKRLLSINFQRIIIDECTQAREPECLIPILKGAQQVILVGDHNQLKPSIKNIEIFNAGLGKSMFERLYGFGVKCFMLKVQYRMHPNISAISSKLFYNSCIKNGVTIEERTDPNTTLMWPNQSTPILFIDISGKEELSSTGKSYLNQIEIMCVLDIVLKLIQLAGPHKTIGVITPYRGQKTTLQYYISTSYKYVDSRDKFKDLEISCVDSFQGREMDYIVLSCVRCDYNCGIGFVGDECRLNVSITRAKYGLIIIGDASLLADNRNWNILIWDLIAKKCIMVNKLLDKRSDLQKIRNQ